MSELWGTGGYIFYKVAGGNALAFYYGNGADEGDASFTEGDRVIAVEADGTYEYVTASSEMTFGANIAYAVKFNIPTSGIIGGKEVSIEAKEKTIETLTEAKEDADTDVEKNEIQNQINETLAQIAGLKNGTEESEGVYALMLEAVTIVLALKDLEDAIAAAQEDMAEAEQEFADAMGNMLHDGYWNDDNYTVGQEESLYADAVEILKVMSRPSVTYSISF